MSWRDKKRWRETKGDGERREMERQSRERETK